MSSNRVGIEGNQRDAVVLDAAERQVLEALRGIRYGAVEILIHDGRIVQIERRVKVRLDVADRRRPDQPGRVTNAIRRAHPGRGGSEPPEMGEGTNE